MKHGPTFLDDGKVAFRLWAPSAKSAELLLRDSDPLLMEAQEDGWYERIEAASPGISYRFRIDGKQNVPDPASRFQPEDVDGASILVDHRSYKWTDQHWKGRPWEETVIYELHVGTFSKRGDYRGVEEKLDHLKSLGITAIELMPLSDFKGKRGWGYDGVLPYAPDSAYGAPEELKHLIDTAHAKGIMVFLDVVYNHFGPAGNYLHSYAEPFFTEKYHTPWGAAIDFESGESRKVREFFIDNAVYWLKEFHFDGLRFDAVHAIYDASPVHFLHELSETIHASLPSDRQVHLILENDKNEAHHLERHFDGQWNDDIHHVFHVLLTGETGGYYEDYADEPLERLGRCLAQGFAYQGEESLHRKGEKRGEPSTHLPPTSFVSFLQNHDQIGNRAFGDRLSALTDEKKLALARAILLLSPHTPMLFMGEEWATKTPFQYFCDFDGELAKLVREGRRKEFAAFPEFADPEKREKIPDPNAITTFQNSQLKWEEVQQAPYQKQLEETKKLLALRTKYLWPLLGLPYERSLYDVLDERGLEVRWEFEGGKLLSLIANFSDTVLTGGAPPAGDIIWGKYEDGVAPWQCAWSISHV